ncbi:potassium channel family protein [Desulfohalovibrio reitneri]|uniref:potassium channel family protein n=1 Tax=Desulfohalovibrio reitneri TaxID=1307759 RepID=UPI0004A7695D|nr:NAD-binding protein [Desulfohalovibrio reitneri]
MRTVFVGAGETAVRTAELLIGRGYQVVIVESDEEKIDAFSEEMDCSFLQGDGSNPAVLRQTNPGDSDVLLCLTNSDQDNIIASLVGRTLGFGRVVTSIADPEYEPICRELGLKDTIIPTRTFSRYLADMVEGVDILELTTYIKDTARYFSFTAGKDEAVSVEELDLPETARVICLYRDGSFKLADRETEIRKGDEVVVLTHSENMAELEKRWRPGSEKEE